MKIAAGSLCTAIQAFACIVLASCQTSEEDLLESPTDEGETINPFSFFYDRAEKKMISKEDFASTQTEEDEADYAEWMKSELFQDANTRAVQETFFYKRLVNMLISNMNVEMEEDDVITGSVNIKIPRSQMEVLRNYDVGVTTLRQIDTILSNAIQAPVYSYTNSIMAFSRLMFHLLQTTFVTLYEYRDRTLMVLGGLLVVIMMNKMRGRRGFPILFLIHLIIIVSFLMTWWNLIQEAEIKLLAKQMEYSQIPITCQPDKMNLWHKFVATVFTGNDCHKYYEAMLSNPKLEVTPAVALVHFVSTVVLHPVGIVGHAISNFVTSATDGLPWTYAWMVKLLLFASIILVILMIPFCLSGASFNLGLGPLLNFGIDFRRRHEKGNAIQEKREPVHIILQVPQGAGIQAITNTSEGGRSKVVRAITNSAPEEKVSNEIEDTEENEQDVLTRIQDLASGDGSKDNEPKVPDTEKATEQEKPNNRPKQEVGSGDC